MVFIEIISLLIFPPNPHSPFIFLVLTSLFILILNPFLILEKIWIIPIIIVVVIIVVIIIVIIGMIIVVTVVILIILTIKLTLVQKLSLLNSLSFMLFVTPSFFLGFRPDALRARNSLKRLNPPFYLRHPIVFHTQLLYSSD